MSIAVMKYLSRLRPRTLRPPFKTLLRTNTNEPCPPKNQETPSPQKTECTPGPPKPLPCSPPPHCPPKPPPCPPLPQCPPSICPTIMDTNNPCNYSPPPCIDPDYPDQTRLKKLQCLFQRDDGIPIHLKRGNLDAFIYQLTGVLVFVSVICSFITMYRMTQK